MVLTLATFEDGDLFADDDVMLLEKFASAEITEVAGVASGSDDVSEQHSSRSWPTPCSSSAPRRVPRGRPNQKPAEEPAVGAYRCKVG
jgi:hypothetical protein